MPPIPTTEKRPFIPAPGVMQVEMIYTYLAQKCENVYHVLQGDGATPPTLAQMNAVAAAAETWESVTGKTYRNNGCVLTAIIVRDLTTQSSPAIIRTPSSAVTGTNADTPLPGNVTIAIKWNTALRGRSFRGRTYHIAIGGSRVVGNQLAAGQVAGLTTAYTALRDAFQGVAGVTMVVLSYAHNKFWRDTAVATPVTVPTVDANTDSQRRRLTGRGS